MLRTVSISFLLPLFFALPLAAFAAECEVELDGSAITLPRELKLSNEAAAFLATVPEHAEVLRSLARVFRALDENHMATVARALNQEPVENTEAVIWPIFADRDLKPDEIQRLASIFRKIPRHRPIQKIYDLRGDRLGGDDPDVFAPERLQSALRSEHYRRAVADLLRIKRVREMYIKVMTALAPYFKFGTMTEADVAALENKLRKGTVNKLEVKLIGMLSRTFALDVANFFSPGDEDFHEVVDREQFLHQMEDYLAQGMGVKTALADIVALMDSHAFGTPLPMLPQQIFDLVVDDAKRQLLPLKSAYSQALSVRSSAREGQNGRASGGPAFELRLVDHFQPRPGPKLREKKVGASDAEELLGVEEEIGPEESLREYTKYARVIRPPGDLRTDQTYKFWFLRDNRTVLQKIRFSADVLAWLAGNPVAGQAFLNALHLGWARETGQHGIKILGKHSAKYAGTVYELKIKASYRGLLIFTRGEWHFVAIAGKDDTMRASEWIAPL